MECSSQLHISEKCSSVNLLHIHLKTNIVNCAGKLTKDNGSYFLFLDYAQAVCGMSPNETKELVNVVRRETRFFLRKKGKYPKH